MCFRGAIGVNADDFSRLHSRGTVTHCFRMACMEKEGKPSRFGPFLLLSRRRLKSISQNVVIGS